MDGRNKNKGGEQQNKNSHKQQEQKPGGGWENASFDFMQQPKQQQQGRKQQQDTDQVTNLRTDTEISAKNQQTAEQANKGGERTLQRFAFDGGNQNMQFLEELDDSKPFDQFQNKQTSYDENKYTTKYDENRLTDEQRRKAKQLELEIKGSNSYGNTHLAEDRQQIDQNDEDEEAKYSNVLRRPEGDQYRGQQVSPRKNQQFRKGGEGPRDNQFKEYKPQQQDKRRNTVNDQPTGHKNGKSYNNKQHGSNQLQQNQATHEKHQQKATTKFIVPKIESQNVMKKYLEQFKKYRNEESKGQNKTLFAKWETDNEQRYLHHELEQFKQSDEEKSTPKPEIKMDTSKLNAPTTIGMNVGATEFKAKPKTTHNIPQQMPIIGQPHFVQTGHVVVPMNASVTYPQPNGYQQNAFHPPNQQFGVFQKPPQQSQFPSYVPQQSRPYNPVINNQQPQLPHGQQINNIAPLAQPFYPQAKPAQAGSHLNTTSSEFIPKRQRGVSDVQAQQQHHQQQPENHDSSSNQNESQQQEPNKCLMSETERKRDVENKQYLVTIVNPILEPMMLEVVRQKPKDIDIHMLQYLTRTFGDRATNGDRSLLRQFYDEIDELTQKLVKLRISIICGMQEEQNKQKQGMSKEVEEEKEYQGSEHQTDEDEEDDYLDVLPEKIQNKNNKPRSSVSSEAFGQWNKKGEFKAKVVHKSEETKQKIITRLSQAFMFSALDSKEKAIVIDAMEERKAQKGDYIIKQGEEGDNLYVCESGVLSCYKLFPGKTEPTFLKKYQPGESFGELSLLYNAPRAASIVADEDAVLWSLDRNTFNHIVKDAASKKREKYEQFLAQISILQTMDSYERSKLADAFKEEHFKPQEYIIKEGEEGQVFYFIQSGECVATKTIKEGEHPQEVMHYKVGDYFGERALIKNEPRAANVIAKTECTVVSMDRHSFKRLMGPLEDILKRNMDLYEKFTTQQ